MLKHPKHCILLNRQQQIFVLFGALQMIPYDATLLFDYNANNKVDSK